MDLSFNLAPSYRDLKDPTSRQNFDDTVEQKRVIDLRACHISYQQYFPSIEKPLFNSNIVQLDSTVCPSPVNSSRVQSIAGELESNRVGVEAEGW